MLKIRACLPTWPVQTLRRTMNTVNRIVFYAAGGTVIFSNRSLFAIFFFLSKNV